MLVVLKLQMIIKQNINFKVIKMNQWDIRFETDQFVYGKEPNAFLKDFQVKLSLPIIHYP